MLLYLPMPVDFRVKSCFSTSLDKEVCMVLSNSLQRPFKDTSKTLTPLGKVKEFISHRCHFQGGRDAVIFQACFHRTVTRLMCMCTLLLQAAGSRPLIFSQWTMVLDILEWLLQCLKLPFVRLDGNTAVAERLTIVDMCAS